MPPKFPFYIVIFFFSWIGTESGSLYHKKKKNNPTLSITHSFIPLLAGSKKSKGSIYSSYCPGHCSLETWQSLWTCSCWTCHYRQWWTWLRRWMWCLDMFSSVGIRGRKFLLLLIVQLPLQRSTIAETNPRQNYFISFMTEFTPLNPLSAIYKLSSESYSTNPLKFYPSSFF